MKPYVTGFVILMLLGVIPASSMAQQPAGCCDPDPTFELAGSSKSATTDDSDGMDNTTDETGIPGYPADVPGGTTGFFIKAESHYASIAKAEVFVYAEAKYNIIGADDPEEIYKEAEGKVSRLWRFQTVCQQHPGHEIPEFGRGETKIQSFCKYKYRVKHKGIGHRSSFLDFVVDPIPTDGKSFTVVLNDSTTTTAGWSTSTTGGGGVNFGTSGIGVGGEANHTLAHSRSYNFTDTARAKKSHWTSCSTHVEYMEAILCSTGATQGEPLQQLHAWQVPSCLI